MTNHNARWGTTWKVGRGSKPGWQGPVGESSGSRHGFSVAEIGKVMSKGLKAGSPKVRSGSGEWTSLTAGAQDLSWEPSRKASVGQGREGLGKLVKEFELPVHFAEQTRAT